jgi:AcrR family transcriptional regulator
VNFMKRDEIKSKAFSLFASKGYHDTSMQVIADAAGINKATLYFYFKGKAELYAEIMRDMIPSMCETITNEIRKIPGDDCEGRLKSIFAVFLSLLPANELLLWKRTMLMCTNEYDDSVKETARELFRERDLKISQITRDILLDIDTGLSKDQIDSYVEFSLATIRGFTDIYLSELLDNRLNIDKVTLVNRVWEQFWYGSKRLLGHPEMNP